MLDDPELRGEFDAIYAGLNSVGSLHFRPGDPLRNVAVIARAHRVLSRR